jgi:hypothetical protein
MPCSAITPLIRISIVSRSETWNPKIVPTDISIPQIGENFVRKRLEFGKNLMIPVLTATVQGVGCPMNSYYAQTTKADLLLI